MKRVLQSGWTFARRAWDGFSRHQGSLHAAGLTYFTLLTFVPVLCLLLLLARTCGVGDLARTEINARITAFIESVETAQDAPALQHIPTTPEARARKREAARLVGAQLRQGSDWVFDRIDTFDVSTLGWVGLAFLVWGVVSTLGMVENSMNEMWDVETARPIWKRCLLYVFEALVLPLFVMLVLSMPLLRTLKYLLDVTTGASAHTRWMGAAFAAWVDSWAFGFAVSFVALSLAFAFVLSVMPHRRVKARAALEAGAITALAFYGWFKLCTILQVGVYNAGKLYGSFALLPILLAWIYVSWQIVLLGVTLTRELQTYHSGGASLGAGADK